MQLSLYSLRDVKAGYYMNVVLLRTNVDAERFFIAILEDKRSPIAKFPKDYAIYHMGTLNITSGELTPRGIPLDVTPHSAVDQIMADNANHNVPKFKEN